ncbi:MAG TPA: hypothetical protein VM347_16165, partial [Nonomuraea sp.]|nr:hypothetical protein [Nonomuraea sp.]
MAHPGSTRYDTRYDSAARQLERAVARTAAGARVAVGLVAVIAATIGAVPPVSARWLVPMLAVELGWTLLFARLVWRRESLPTWLAAGDVAITVVLCLAQRDL